MRFLGPQKVWGWEIAIYLSLAGMGAGSFIIGVVAGWSGYSLNPLTAGTFLGYPLDFSKAVFRWGPVLVALGAPFLILDLGIKRRFLYACLNPKTSWVARGFLILSTFIITGLVTLVISMISFHWEAEIVNPCVVVEIISVLFAFATAIYTGILLKSVKYVSLWNTAFLPFLFLISALSTGSMAIILSTLGYGLLVSIGNSTHQMISSLIGLEQILLLIESLVLALYLFFRFRAKDQGGDSVRLLLTGDMKLLFWGGIIVVGFFFPVVLEYLYSNFPGYPILLLATGLFLFLGGFFLRFGILTAGIKDQPPIHKLIETQYRLKTFK